MPPRKTANRLLLRETSLLMLIDGHALVHRAWHAIQRPLTLSSTGQDVRGVYGFTATFLKAIGEFRPTYVAIAFDRPTPTFRHREFTEYKAQRPEAPQELRQQFTWVRRIMETFGVPIYEVDGYEADDLLGTLCAQAEDLGLETVILTGDTDTLQLVSPLVKVALYYRIQDRVLFDEARVRERYGGLSPLQLADLKALKGDPTDNIPGVPGVGEKTAVRLLLQFGSLDGIFQALERVGPERVREALKAHREEVYRWRELTTIVRTAPVSLDLESARFWRYNRREVVDLFRELEFFSLVERVPEGEAPPQQPALIPSAEVPAPSEALDYRTVASAEELEALARELAQAPAFAFDLETTETDPVRAGLVGLSFATRPGRACYVPVGHTSGLGVPLEEALRALRPLLEDTSRPKVAHNANFDMTALGVYGVTVRGLAFDTMLAAQVLGKKSVGLKALALDLLGEEMTPIKALIGTGREQRSMARVPVEEASPYACADADMTLRLRPVLEAQLRQQGTWDLFATVEMPLVPVIVRMQLTGVAIDVALLREMSRQLGEQLRRLEEQAYSAVGHIFNLSSPRQLSQVLFEELRLARGKRTKTGYSTDAATLESLRGAHPVVDIILEYRQLSKLKSTYVDALPEAVNPRTGRIHTSYNQIGASTGRMSSSEPNLQNIPIRTELGRQIRRAFIPGEPGWLMVAADYSQVELRVLAHLSGDPALIEAFRQDLDIHSATASQVFGVPLGEVTPAQRRLAKVLNFGVIYGLTAYGISQQTELTPEEGQRFIEDYFSRFPGVRAYIEATKEKARTLGYVETLLGRRRYIPEINSPNANIRSAAEREAINMPVQGTAADLMKVAMRRVQEGMDSLGLRARMLLQVHDELIFEAPPEEVEPLRGLLLEVMPRALDLVVPLKVKVSVGRNWDELD